MAEHPVLGKMPQPERLPAGCVVQVRAVVLLELTWRRELIFNSQHDILFDLNQARRLNESAEQLHGHGWNYGDLFLFTSTSWTSFSRAVSMAFSPGAPIHLYRITPFISRT
jgi:hypothetical protein